MKILGGQLKNRNFYMPAHIRPTQNLLRKAVFDILGEQIEGASFVDLFAGSGSMGFEAISRGAKTVVWVERDPKCVKVIEENVQLLCPEASANHCVMPGDAFTAIRHLHRGKKKFDLAFLDPPYGEELAKKTLKTIFDHDILRPHCFIISQSEKRDLLTELGGRFKTLTQRAYGASILTIYEGQ